MYWDVAQVRPRKDHRLHVELVAGVKGVFYMKLYFEFGVFRKLKDLEYFRQVASCSRSRGLGV